MKEMIFFFSHTKSLSNLGKKAVEYTASKSDRKARKKYIREDKEELAIIVTTMSRLPTTVTMYMSRNIVNNSLCPVGSGVRLRKINSMTLLLCLIYSSVCIVSKSLQKRKYYEFWSGPWSHSIRKHILIILYIVGNPQKSWNNHLFSSSCKGLHQFLLISL